MSEGLRVDKWLWQARFFKSRSRASRMCAKGRLRLNGAAIRKAHHVVRPGDVMTFPQVSGKGAKRAPKIRVVRVVALGLRRGPAAEARCLYEDLAPAEVPALAVDLAPAEAPALAVAARDRGMGRPTKAERRAVDRLSGRDRA